MELNSSGFKDINYPELRDIRIYGALYSPGFKDIHYPELRDIRSSEYWIFMSSETRFNDAQIINGFKGTRT